MDATCTIQDSIHVFRLVHKYVSRILGTYQMRGTFLISCKILFLIIVETFTCINTGLTLVDLLFQKSTDLIFKSSLNL